MDLKKNSYKGHSNGEVMRNSWSRLWMGLGLLFWGMTATGLALGGAGGDQDTGGGETVRKIKMVPLDETNQRTYGWVRISADTLSLGANHLQPDAFYTVYFENATDKQEVGENPTIRTSGAGEAKFTLRLTEPLGAKWGRIVMYQHEQNKEQRDGPMQPVMEAKLR